MIHCRINLFCDSRNFDFLVNVNIKHSMHDPLGLQIMFRAGQLSTLEEIREGALAKIFLKMQCQCRRVLIKIEYDIKRNQK
jgi:hypothetical protein